MPSISGVSNQASDLDNQSVHSASGLVGPKGAVKEIADQSADLRILPKSTKKLFLKPALWSRPINPKGWLDRTINNAIKTLPKKIITEMSRLPGITPELAARKNTTVENLRADYQKYAATHATYHLAHAVNAAMDKDWAPAAREAATPQINRLAHQMIVGKLEALLQPAQLQAAISQVPKFAQANPDNMIGQSEYFAFHELIDSTILEVLNSSIPNGFDASTASPQSKDIDQAFKSLSGSELKQRYLRVSDSMLLGLTEFAKAYDGFVSQAGVDSREVKTGQLLDVVRLHEGTYEPAAQQFLNKQVLALKQKLDEALDGLSPEVKEAFLWTLVQPHLQKLDKKATSLARNLPAIQTALVELETMRQPGGGSQVRQKVQAWTSDHQTWLVSSALQGAKSTIETLGLSEVREAYASNRSGFATRDSGVYRHIEKVAGPLMLYGLAPMHRRSVLNALADYGEAVTRFFSKKNLSIRSSQPGVGLKDRPQRTFAQVYKNYNMANSTGQRLYVTPQRQAEKLSVQPTLKQMVSYEQGSLAAPHFSSGKNEVVMSRLFSSKGETTAVHELGHALDHHTRPLTTFSGFGSSASKALRQEHARVQQEKSGLTAYGQSHVHEYMAESFAALLDQHGAGSTYASFEGANGLYSRENLKLRQPVAFDYTDEVVKNPEKPARARALIRQP